MPPHWAWLAPTSLPPSPPASSSAVGAERSIALAPSRSPCMVMPQAPGHSLEVGFAGEPLEHVAPHNRAPYISPLKHHPHQGTLTFHGPKGDSTTPGSRSSSCTPGFRVKPSPLFNLVISYVAFSPCFRKRGFACQAGSLSCAPVKDENRKLSFGF